MNPFLDKKESRARRWSSAYRAVTLLVARQNSDKAFTKPEARRKLTIIEQAIGEATVSLREGRYNDHLPTWTFDPARDFKDGVLTDSPGLDRVDEGSVGAWAMRAEEILQGLG
ncbi:hypothetical protein LCGC14_1915190, partial [marine sediment metagenome]